ncbi:SctD/MshK family protein [Pseudomonas sp. UBA1879]|uniref:SctD/MshK family protein n=1 Tax=Pseudomonas sp. UBA1879 TaxID=1947305 RepID=UPI0025D8E3A2|nr:EscD/YscD/HrpQ family type III secretion system periplasmic domain-containing protein [Pseudomonas sp. UBA1879]
MTAQISLTSTLASTVPGKRAPLLSITRGLHQGVCLSLDKAAYIVGSAGSADLLLSDAGIVERHMALRFSKGQVAVEALGGEILVIGRNAREIRIPLGSGHRAHLPVDIRLGTASLTLSDADSERPRADKPTYPLPFKPHWIIALALMFLCVGAFAFRGEPHTLAQAAPAPLPVTTASQHSADAADAGMWLEKQLATAGLNQIKVSETGGQLSVRGSYDPASKARWRAVQQAFDSRFGQAVVLHTAVTARAEVATPRVRFQAVWFGPDPYVVNEDGKRLYPGATVADDWTLERIENDQVILARGEERFTFTL